MISGIPEGVGDAEYIEYRKCKYVEDIKAVRGFLTKTLSPGRCRDEDFLRRGGGGGGSCCGVLLVDNRPQVP